MGWLVFACLLIFLAILPVGIRAIYDTNGARLWILTGPVHYKIYPRNCNAKNTKITGKKEARSVSSSKDKERSSSGGSLTDFLPLLQRVFAFLSKFRRKLRVNALELHLTLAGDDPADVALNYGKTWVSVANLIPLLERFFIIKKRDVAVNCCFTGDKTTVSAQLELSITIARFLGLVIWHGSGFLREYLKIMKRRKGGTRI